MSKLSSYMRLNRIWSSNNLPVAFIVFSAVLMPVFTVSLDMFYSDTQVILQLWQYINTIMGTDNLTMIVQIQQILPKLFPFNITKSSFVNSTDNTDNPNENAASFVFLMFFILALIYSWSMFCLFVTPWLASLLTSYRTSVSLLKEEIDMVTNLGNDMFSFYFVFQNLHYILDCATRYDLSLDESGGEASLQSAIQWATYLSIQLAIAMQGIEESEDFTFKALCASGILGLISVSLGQVKVSNSTKVLG